MSTILRSIAGRLFGIDATGYATSPNGLKVPELLVGPSGSEVSMFGANAVTAASTGSAISGAGFTTLAVSKTYTMTLPPVGSVKTLFLAATSTLTSVTLVSGTFSSTSGLTQTIATFTVAGSLLSVRGGSTTAYVESNIGPAALS